MWGVLPTQSAETRGGIRSCNYHSFGLFSKATDAISPTFWSEAGVGQAAGENWEQRGRTLHHSKVDLAMNVYDKSSPEDIRDGLRVVTKKLLSSDLLPKDLLPSTPKPNEGGENAA